MRRLETGAWSGLSPADLNAAAAELSPLNALQIGQAIVATPPAYISFKPTAFPRPFSIDEGDQGSAVKNV